MASVAAHANDQGAGSLATIRDVAKRAGVAISTASAAINRSAPVSADVIAKVEEAVRDLGYVPHGAAQSLRSGQSRLIGLVVPDIANPWCGAIAREIENVCLKAGYTTVVYSTGQDAERESQVLNMMRVQRVAGLIVIPTRSDAVHGHRLVGQIHVPTVLLDMYVEGLPFDVVKTDNVAAGRLATEHLLSLGHRRIALISGIPGLATSDDRQAGYVAALAGHGVALDPDLIVPGHFDQDRARAAATRLMNLAEPPTAIVAISNMMTMGLLLALKELGRRIPEDVSVVGIDDLDFAMIIDPPPTIVATPTKHMARRAIELLLTELAGQHRPTGNREINAPSLVVRASTRAVTT